MAAGTSPQRSEPSLHSKKTTLRASVVHCWDMCAPMKPTSRGWFRPSIAQNNSKHLNRTRTAGSAAPKCSYLTVRQQCQSLPRSAHLQASFSSSSNCRGEMLPLGHQTSWKQSTLTFVAPPSSQNSFLIATSVQGVAACPAALPQTAFGPHESPGILDKRPQSHQNRDNPSASTLAVLNYTTASTASSVAKVECLEQ